MTKERVAICVISTNDNYVYKAIITLLSTKQHNQENTNFSYFVCGDLAEKYKKVVKKYGLEVMPMNLDNIFGNHKSLRWTTNIFWLCAIAEVFDNQGFKYAIALDGDIFCVNKIPFNEVKKTKQLAFIKLKKLSDMNFNHYGTRVFTNHKVIKKFNIRLQDFSKKWMSSGVGIFNNQNLVKNKLKQKFIKYYQNLVSITDDFEGDEVIFMLLKIHKKINFDYLGNDWNNLLDSRIEGKIIFLHLLYKPWKYKIFWSTPKLSTGSNYCSVEEYQQRRIKYQQLYIIFAKKIYGYKFYIYYMNDLMSIINIAKNIKKLLPPELKRIKDRCINLINSINF